MADDFLTSVTVKVPATTANMGPGFDCIGMALDLWNEVTVSRGGFGIEIEGEGVGEIPLDARNLTVTGVDAAFNAAGLELPPLRYRCVNRIPMGKGLGSSSAAIVAGLVAGSVLSGANLTKHKMVGIAADIEGHPDNVAPAIFGGCVVGVRSVEDLPWTVGTVPVPKDMHCVIYVPDTTANTHESRARLPEQISRSDAIYNIGRAALLTAALATGELELLKQGTEDRLHQPYRAAGFKAMTRIIKAAMNGGAYGAFLSGSGPVVAALTRGREVTVSYEMSEAARIGQLPGRPMILAPAPKGAYVSDKTGA